MNLSGKKSVPDMARTIRYHPEFENDVIEAANWYDSRSPGLGDAFAANVLQATESIISDPDRFSLTFKELRYQQVKRFPYIVLFSVTETSLFFLGTLHTARSFEKWRKRRS